MAVRRAGTAAPLQQTEKLLIMDVLHGAVRWRCFVMNRFPPI